MKERELFHGCGRAKVGIPAAIGGAEIRGNCIKLAVSPSTGVFDLRQLAVSPSTGVFDLRQLAVSPSTSVFDLRQVAVSSRTSFFDLRQLAVSPSTSVFDLRQLAVSSRTCAFDFDAGAMAGLFLHRKNYRRMHRLEIVLMDETRDFISSLPEAAAYKIYYNMRRVAGGDRSSELFKKLEGSEIWEFRTFYNKACYRIFAFWDTMNKTLVVATHGIVKKTRKTPLKEIAKAEAIRIEYFKSKS